MAPRHVSRGRAWAAGWGIGNAHSLQPPRRCGRSGLPAARAGLLCRDRAARHVDDGAGAQGLSRKDTASLHRRRVLHEDAREPAADRAGSDRRRLHFLRVLRLWRDGVVRGRRAHRSPHHGVGFTRLRAGLSVVAVPGCRLLRIARTMGRWRSALSVRAWRDEARRRLTRPCHISAK